MDGRKSSLGSTSVVAAIDFGTTYSSCAYSFRDEFAKNPLEIVVNNKWSGGVDATSVPTSVLLNKKQKFVAFGSEAEEKYEKQALIGDHYNWHLFRRFKMTLHNNKNLDLNTEIEDENGRKMRAVIIFGFAIKDIKDQLIHALERNGHKIAPNDIHWVLTVPAIWTERAKQFMQKAAEKAGILGPRNNLTLALEPEAAAVFCKELTVHQKQGQDKSLLKAFDPGSRYLVLDLGGGTVDVTTQEVLKPEANLKILDKASGGAWGGVTVDRYFLDFIRKLVGLELYNEFSAAFPFQQMRFEKDMESCKRKATPDTKNQLTITIPSELKEMYEKTTKKKFDSDLAKQTSFRDDIKIIGSEMVIQPTRIHTFYENTIKSIIGHVKTTLAGNSAKGVSYILLVGGFAESKLVEERIKGAFEGAKMKVIVPREAGHAVVKGAVIFGHNPNAIAERVSPYTYGVETRRPFNPKLFAEDKKSISDGKEVVNHVFDKHITAGEIMYVGKPNKEHIFYTINPKVDHSSWKVYCTEAKNPTFCDEYGCDYLGTVKIKLEGLDGKEKRELGFRMTCQGTVLEAEAYDKKSKKWLAAEFDFLGQ